MPTIPLRRLPQHVIRYPVTVAPRGSNKVMSDSPEPVAVGLVNSVFHFPLVQVKFLGICFEEIQITEVLNVTC